MKRVYGLVAISIFFISCTPAQPPAPAPAAPAAKAYGTLAQMMRGIPFPNSNIIFDTQSTDPAAAQKPPEAGAPASQTFAGVYGGWQAVENAALALQETAQPADGSRPHVRERPAGAGRSGRLQEVGAGAGDAGAAAYKAAQSKNMDQMVEVSGTVADACAACHEKYRDKEDLKMRCIPVTTNNLALRGPAMAEFMMPLRNVFQWVSEFPTSIAIRESLLFSPYLTVAHVVSMCLFAGLIVMMDLRLLGIGNMSTPFSELQKRLFPVADAGHGAELGHRAHAGLLRSRCVSTSTSSSGRRCW